MNRILKLTRILLKTGSSSSNKNNGKKGKAIVLYIIMAIAFLPLISMVVGVTGASYVALAKIHQEGVILAMGVAISCVIVMLFGIFYVLSTFYFSQDIEHLLPLPLKPSEILLSKFIVVVIYEYLTELFILAPLLITYGVVSNAGVLYYIYTVLIYFTLPIIPLVIDAFIIMVIMRFTNLGRHKDALKVVGGSVGIILGIGIQVLSRQLSGGNGSKAQSAEEILKHNNSLINSMTALFPSSKIVVNSLINSSNINGLINIILYIIITFAVLEIMNVLGEAIYFKGVIGINQTATSGKKITKKELEASTTQSSALKSYTLKELKLLVRTPAYFLNCVIINFIIPIFVIVPNLGNHKLMSSISNAGNLMNNPRISSIILAGSFAFMLFMSGINPTACTAISREGKNLFTTKYMPVSYRTQILGKVLSAVIINLIGLVIILITAVFLIKLPMTITILILISSMLAIFFTSFIGILIDLNFPKLEWDDEQRAVKQNMNVILCMIITMVLGGITVAGLIFLHQSLFVTFGIILVVYGIIDLILYGVVTTMGVEVFDKLEG